MSKLQCQVALVTGASKGIGAGIARELAAAGAAVVANYASDRTGADAVVDAITAAGGRAVAIQADVAKSADVVELFERAKETFGSLDILVNNAGVYRAMPVAELTEEEFHREINVNLLGPLLVIRESLRHFGPNGGSIINIGSGASRWVRAFAFEKLVDSRNRLVLLPQRLLSPKPSMSAGLVLRSDGPPLKTIQQARRFEPIVHRFRRAPVRHRPGGLLPAEFIECRIEHLVPGLPRGFCDF